VVIYFFRDGCRLPRQGFGMHSDTMMRSSTNPMLLWWLAIGSIPVGIAGLLFNKQADGPWRNPFVIGGMLIGVGLLMLVAENAGRHVRDLSMVTLADAVSVGWRRRCGDSGRIAERHNHRRRLFRNLDRNRPRVSLFCCRRPPSPRPPPGAVRYS